MRLAAISLTMLASAAQGATQNPPVAGQNVNMVTGTRLPNGDPFLQRQNEPSMAVSSLGTGHLFAASNDYRTVDVPSAPGSGVTTDAWLGVYRSVDGGQTWQTRILPGYPQQNQVVPDTIGLASPLAGWTDGAGVFHKYNAAADPTVRPGVDGMMFVSGMAFNRTNDDSAIFVARYYDDGTSTVNAVNDMEPFHYIDTHISAYGSSLDRPAFLVDIPRPGAAICGATQKPAGMMYQAFTAFSNNQSQVVVTTSRDCGVTWTVQPQLSSTQQLNQGTSMAIDPIDGTVWVAWRRIGSSGQPDAILLARSISQGATFTPQQGIVLPTPNLNVYDVTGDGTKVRVLTLPVIAISVDGAGQRRLHVAWSQQDALPGSAADARIYMTTSSPFDATLTGGKQWQSTSNQTNNNWVSLLTWTTPAAIDEPTTRWTDAADSASMPYARGNQFMPAMTFNQGRLAVVYYDTRFDSTRRYLDNATFLELLGPVGALIGGTDRTILDSVFLRDASGNIPGDPYFVDLSSGTIVPVPWTRRHTVEVRVATAQIDPGLVSGANGANPSFKSARVSKYPAGVATSGQSFNPNSPGAAFQATATTFGGTKTLFDGADFLGFAQQTANFYNLPIFRNGTAPFLGDYIDVAGPSFITVKPNQAVQPDPNTYPYGWKWNYAPVASPVLHAVWTTNHDVQPPPDGNWQKYSPIKLTQPVQGSTSGSVYFPGTDNTTNFCDANGAGAYTGTRNQNIYTARIVEGLYVYSPEPTKTLTIAADPSHPSSYLRRSFVIAAQNVTGSPFDLAFCLSDSSGRCLVDQSGFSLPSGVRAASFVNNFATGLVLKQTQDSTGLNLTVPANSTIAQTLFVDGDGTAATPTMYVTACQVTTTPATCPGTGWYGVVTLNAPGAVPLDVGAGENVQPAFGPFNPATDVQNINLLQLNLTQLNLTQLNLTQLNLTQLNLTQLNLTQLNLTQLNLTQLNLTQSPSQLNLTQSTVPDGQFTEATFQLTNTGDTTATYVIDVPASGGLPTLVRTSSVSGVPNAVGCTLTTSNQQVNQFSTSVYGSSGLNTGKALVTIQPKQTVQLTLSLPGSTADAAGILDNVTLTATAQSALGDGVTKTATLLQIPATTISGTVAVPLTGQVVTAIGGTPFTDSTGSYYQWSLDSPNVTDAGGTPFGTDGVFGVGLKTGLVTGTPVHAMPAGTYFLHVTVLDAVGSTRRRAIPITIGQGTQTITITSAPTSKTYGDAPFSIVASASSGLPVSFTSNTPSTCTINGTGLVTIGGAGPCTINVSQAGNADYSAATTQTVSITINTANQTVTVVPPSVPVSFSDATFTVSATTSATDAVTFTFTSSTTGVCTIGTTTGATAIVNIKSAGTCTIQAAASSTGNYNSGTSAPTSVTINPGIQSVTFASTIPTSVLLGETFLVSATSTSLGPIAFSTNTAVCTINAVNVVTAVAGGTCRITAVATDPLGNYATKTVTLDVTVNPVAQTLTVTAPSPVYIGAPDFTVSVTSTAIIAGIPVNTGLTNFTFTSSPVGVCTVGTTTGVVHVVNLGTCRVTAAQAGNASFTAATGFVDISIVYVFTGFNPTPIAVSFPTGTGGATSMSTISVNAGSKIGLKWKLQTYSGAIVNNLNTTDTIWAYVSPSGCGKTAIPNPFPPTTVNRLLVYNNTLMNPTFPAAGNSALNLDSTGSQFVYNWDTGKSLSVYPNTGVTSIGAPIVPAGNGTCYELVLILSDGTSKTAYVILK